MSFHTTPKCINSFYYVSIVICPIAVPVSVTHDQHDTRTHSHTHMLTRMPCINSRLLCPLRVRVDYSEQGERVRIIFLLE